MIVYWCAFMLMAAVDTAAFDNNLDYGSPSHRHPHLGMDKPRFSTREDSSRNSNDPETLRFTHGVPSGDPLPDSIILWTRVAPTMEDDASNITVEGDVPLYDHDSKSYVSADPNPVCVEYRIGTDKKYLKVVDEGKAYTTPTIDYTVEKYSPSGKHGFDNDQIEEKKLEPFTEYHYQFTVCGVRNPLEISLAKFTVKAGANCLQRDVAGGSVESGALKSGSTKQTNMTDKTETGKWNVTHFEKMLIEY